MLRSVYEMLGAKSLLSSVRSSDGCTVGNGVVCCVKKSKLQLPLTVLDGATSTNVSERQEWRLRERAAEGVEPATMAKRSPNPLQPRPRPMGLRWETCKSSPSCARWWHVPPLLLSSSHWVPSATQTGL